MPTPKTILCFISSLSGGGAEKQMIELMNGLHEKGYKISLLTYSHNDDYQCPEYIKRYIAYSKNKYFRRLKLIKYLKTIKYDCCISFLGQNNLIACISTLPFKRHKLIVGERNSSSLYNWYHKLLYKLYARTDYIVANSRTKVEFIQQKASNLKPKLRTITNYTNLDIYHPINVPSIDDGFIKVGIFARYIKQKNPLYLAHVAKILKEENYKFKFYWYGNNQLNRNNLSLVTQEYTDLKEFITINGLSDYFILNGFAKDVVQEINRMDIICLPSLFEGFPNAISEGLACGKFIIASNVSAVPDIVEDGVNGFLIDPHNVQSGVDAFIKYSNLPDERKNNITKINREKAEKIFSKERYINSYIELIEN